MKNIDELYEKYYNAYESGYDNDDELTEVKKKKFDYKLFKWFDKTYERLKLHGETKRFFKETKNREKGVDNKVFTKYFSYETTTLVNKLLGQNTQDLRKSLDELKQKNDELNKDERNSTNNKNENDRLNMILSVIDRIYQFFEYKFLSGKESDQSMLPKWIKVSKKRFDVIKNKVQNAKKK